MQQCRTPMRRQITVTSYSQLPIGRNQSSTVRGEPKGPILPKR